MHRAHTSTAPPRRARTAADPREQQFLDWDYDRSSRDTAHADAAGHRPRGRGARRRVEAAVPAVLEVPGKGFRCSSSCMDHRRAAVRGKGRDTITGLRRKLFSRTLRRENCCARIDGEDGGVNPVRFVHSGVDPLGRNWGYPHPRGRAALTIKDRDGIACAWAIRHYVKAQLSDSWCSLRIAANFLKTTKGTTGMRCSESDLEADVSARDESGRGQSWRRGWCDASARFRCESRCPKRMRSGLCDVLNQLACDRHGGEPGATRPHPHNFPLSTNERIESCDDAARWRSQRFETMRSRLGCEVCYSFAFIVVRFGVSTASIAAIPTKIPTKFPRQLARSCQYALAWEGTPPTHARKNISPLGESRRAAREFHFPKKVHKVL